MYCIVPWIRLNLVARTASSAWQVDTIEHSTKINLEQLIVDWLIIQEGNTNASRIVGIISSDPTVNKKKSSIYDLQRYPSIFVESRMNKTFLLVELKFD